MKIREIFDIACNVAPIELSKIFVERMDGYDNSGIIIETDREIKKVLFAVALGLKPSLDRMGKDEANGGYIIVTSEGNVLAYHIYNRDSFETYLLKNTKLERGSTTKHNYAGIYSQEDNDNEYYINLNLQIRFK